MLIRAKTLGVPGHRLYCEVPFPHHLTTDHLLRCEPSGLDFHPFSMRIPSYLCTVQIVPKVPFIAGVSKTTRLVDANIIKARR